jgi:translocation and assembly module TamB
LRVEVPRIDRELLAPFVDAGEFDATLALYAVGDGNAEAFDLGASLTGTLAGGGVNHPVRAELDASQSGQSLVVDFGPSARHWGRIDAKTRVPVFAVIGGADWKTSPVEVRVDLSEIDIGSFGSFTPVEIQDIAGKLSANATVLGTLGAPKLDGSVRLTDGAATIVPARQRIKKLELTAALTNESLNLSKLRFEAGGGSVQGHGAVQMREGSGLVGTVDLALDDVPIRSPGMPRMSVTSKVATKVEMDPDDLGVEVRLADTKVDVFTSKITAGEPIPANDNVVFVDFDEPPPREVIGDEPPPPPGRQTRFSIVLAEPLRIVGPSVDMSWKGKIEAEGNDATGALTADKGYFDLLGNDFDIEHGTVTLPDDGSNLPFVDLVAHTTVDDVQITATVRGKLPKPELILSSSPSMSQSEIFTVLVTGSADTESADPDEVEAKAASVLAAMSNPALQRQLNERLHIDRVGVGFGESTEQPILSAGKNVTKKVYVESQYHHNAPRRENRAELRVQYRFAPRWSVETFFGDAAAGGVDLFWGRAFDSKPKRK